MIRFLVELIVGITAAFFIIFGFGLQNGNETAAIILSMMCGFISVVAGELIYMRLKPFLRGTADRPYHRCL